MHLNYNIFKIPSERPDFIPYQGDCRRVSAMNNHGILNPTPNTGATSFHTVIASEACSENKIIFLLKTNNLNLKSGHGQIVEKPNTCTGIRLPVSNWPMASSCTNLATESYLFDCQYSMRVLVSNCFYIKVLKRRFQVWLPRKRKVFNSTSWHQLGG